MKKKYLFLGLAAVLALGAVSCNKEKTCRCSVLHSSKVRIIKIEGGNCEDLKLFKYHTMLDSLKVDSLLCTDYEFQIDQ
ncbi:MAG: hypothetical protein J5677_03120 [Bacteroidales bacterium]|nr:hypothetical protein [Bacteroidales bacterium]